METLTKETVFENFTPKTVNRMIQYKEGLVVPGLLYSVDGVTTSKGQIIGPHAIVFVNGRYVVVFPGDYIQYEKVGDLDRATAIFDEPTVRKHFRPIMN